MREIKFRAYDKHLKVIRDVAYIDFYNKEIMYWIDDEQTTDIVRGYGEVELMQYIGMKDTEDREIYEGDIVKYITKKNLEIEESITEVVFENCSFCLNFKNKYVVGGRYAMAIFNLRDEFTNSEVEFEIIGNIYENPELVEVEE